MENRPSPDSRKRFPSRSEPRVWLIAAGDSPIGISVARQVLAHGDSVVLGLSYSSLARDQRRRDGYDLFLAEVEDRRADGWGERLKAI